MAVLDPEFVAAWIDGSEDPNWSTYRVLGRKLRPFCLWHRLLLKAVDSPFLKGKAQYTLRDVRIFVGICSLGYGQSKTRKPWIIPATIYVRAFLVAIFSRKKAELNPLQRILTKQIEQALEYAGEYLQEPEFCIIPAEKRPKQTRSTPRGRCPDELEQIADIIGWTGWSQRTCWELPIGQANWLRICALQAKGNDIDFVTEEEREFQESLPPEYRRSQN